MDLEHLPEAPDIRILVLDDSRLYRDAVADTLRCRPWVGAVETAADGATAMLCDVAFPPTVTLLNMATEESLGWLRALSDARARVVVLGVRETEAELVSCAECGAAGYLLRSDSVETLFGVIQAVARDETICSPKTTAVLLRRVAALAEEKRSRNGLGSLTRRESQILGLIEQGLANFEIAKELHIEVRTVKNHVHAILGKLGVERRGQAAACVRAGRTPLAGAGASALVGRRS
jgi:DNA-binding NarL/FixJ family response regulator